MLFRSSPILPHLSLYPVPATRRSQARASSRPPPKANPSTAAMVGAGKAAVETKDDGSACEALVGPGQCLRVGDGLGGCDRRLHWPQAWGPLLVPQPGYLSSFPTGESCGISWGIGVGRWMGRVMPGQAHSPVGLPGISLFALPSHSVCWEQN